MKFRFAAFSLCAAATLACPAQSRPAKVPLTRGEHRPKLLLAIIVDQFRFDYTTRFAARYTGGLHTMLNGGAVYLDAHQDHYPTVTATGHATFLTGSTPATSGIIGTNGTTAAWAARSPRSKTARPSCWAELRARPDLRRTTCW